VTAAALRVWVAPDAAGLASDAFVRVLGERGTVDLRPLDHLQTLDGPAVILFTPADAIGVHRKALRELLARAAPARPVMWGGTRTKDVLLDAINHWGVSGVVPEGTPNSLLFDAVQKSFEAARTEVALENAERDLDVETQQLRTAVAKLEDTRERLLHAERLTTIGRFTTGLTEFMRQQQARFEAFETAARKVTNDEELLELMDQGLSGLDAVSVLLGEIAAYADDREQTYELREVDLDRLVERAVRFTRFDPLRRARHVEIDVQSQATVLVDRQRIDQVLINLLRNACEATSDGGHINVRTRRVGGDAVIEVIDDGCGMEPQIADRVFEAFFSTKGEGGLGLGLGITRATVERHGGRIECASEPGVGTTFTIVLAVVQSSTAPIRTSG